MNGSTENKQPTKKTHRRQLTVQSLDSGCSSNTIMEEVESLFTFTCIPTTHNPVLFLRADIASRWSR